MSVLAPKQGVLARTYTAPIALAAVSGAGLLLALVGDEAWDLASWVMLGAPIAITGWFWLTPARRLPR